MRLGNLNKLKKGLEKYYVEVLRIPHTNIVEHIEISAIARSADKANIVFLLELVMGAIVKCPAKEAYISRILSLDERFQAELMVFLQKILERIENKRSTDEDSSETRADTLQLRQENRSYKVEIEELQNSLDEIAQKQLELITEKEIYIKQIKSMEGELEKRTSKRFPGDFNVSQLESQISQRDTMIQELRVQNAELKRQQENEVSRLRDDLDVANEKIINMGKTEATLEVYKKRLEDNNVLKKKIKDLDKENAKLKERLKECAEGITELDSLKSTLEYFKEQHSKEKERVAEFSFKLEERERELRDTQKARDEINQKKYFFENQVIGLRSELENLKYRQDSGRGDDDYSLGRNIASDYEEKIQKLEMENRKLRNSVGGEGIIKEINAQLDRVLIEKKNAEEKGQNEHRENLELKRELDTLRREINHFKEEANNKTAELISDLNNSHESLQKLQNKVAELEKEKAQLEHVSSENERLKKEKESHIQDMKGLFKEKDEVQQRIMESKDEVHKLQYLIGQKEAMLRASELEKEKMENRLKEAVESERIATSELHVLRNKTEVTDSSVDKIRFLEQERDIMKLNSEISNLKLNSREKDDNLLQVYQEKNRREQELTQLLKQREDELNSAHQEELENIRKDMSQKASEISYLNKVKEEITNSWNKEMKLMSIVVHEVGMDILRANRTLKDDKSWMNVKRATKN